MLSNKLEYVSIREHHAPDKEMVACPYPHRWETCKTTQKLDTYMESKGLRFVRYADDFSIFCKSKQEASKQGNDIYLFLKNKLKLPINKQKSGIRKPKDFSILGYSFVPTYKKE